MSDPSDVPTVKRQPAPEPPPDRRHRRPMLVTLTALGLVVAVSLGLAALAGRPEGGDVTRLAVQVTDA